MADKIWAAMVGCGNMGGAILERWFEAGYSADDIIVVDPKPGARAQAMKEKYGLKIYDAWPEGVKAAAVVMGVKPQMMDDVAKQLLPHLGKKTLIVSIAAGRTIESIEEAFEGRPVVRTMPNTPIAVGKGAIVFAASDKVDDDHRKLTRALLEPGGFVGEAKSEADMDAVTGVSGSGPAYIYLMTEALAGAGRAAGLEPELANRLARQTVIGAAAMMDADPDKSPADMRNEVTSPGGTTAAALDVLYDSKDTLPGLMRRAVDAAERRAKELAK